MMQNYIQSLSRYQYFFVDGKEDHLLYITRHEGVKIIVAVCFWKYPFLFLWSANLIQEVLLYLDDC